MISLQKIARLYKMKMKPYSQVGIKILISNPCKEQNMIGNFKLDVQGGYQVL